MAKAKKNEQAPRLVKILGGTFLAMIAVIIASPLIKERPEVRAASQEPTVGAHGSSSGAQYSEHSSQYRDPFEDLIATHPDSGVNTDLYRLIERGEILISHNAQETATFGLVSKDKLPGLGSLPEGTFLPVLNLNPDFPTRERARDQLVIFHEYVHYRQWKDGTQPAETFILRPVSASRDIQDPCTKKWYAEVDAYHQERAFARETGLIEQLDPRMSLYRVLHAPEEEFQRVVLEESVRGDRSAAMCASVWEQLVR